MITDRTTIERKRESGNALFLILIAVALFAALSYAITQSGRGTGNVNSETDLITAGQVTEQPAAVRTAVTRMVITGTSPNSIIFTAPAGDSTDAVNVFATTGGGATAIAPPSGACSTTSECTVGTGTPAYGWTYVPATVAGGDNNFVEGVGSTTSGLALAVLQPTHGITSDVCVQINKGLGITPTPVTLGAAVTLPETAHVAYAAAGSASTIGDSAGALLNQEFACVANTTLFMYYNVLVEQ